MHFKRILFFLDAIEWRLYGKQLCFVLFRAAGFNPRTQNLQQHEKGTQNINLIAVPENMKTVPDFHSFGRTSCISKFAPGKFVLACD